MKMTHPFLVTLTGLSSLLVFAALLLSLVAFSLHLESGTGLSLHSFFELASTGIYATVIANSVSIAFWTATGAVAAGTGLAVAVRAVGGWRERLMIALSIVPLATPTITRAFGWLLVLGKGGPFADVIFVDRLLFGRGAVLMALIHAFLPLSFLLVRGALALTPRAEVEACYTLGGNPIATWRQVVLRHIGPTLLLSWFLIFFSALGAYVTPMLLGGSRELMLSWVLESRMNYLLDLNIASAFALAIWIGSLVCAGAAAALVRLVRLA
jgi:ABC-type spermidine/putrescine transport system permease subunit I